MHRPHQTRELAAARERLNRLESIEVLKLLALDGSRTDYEKLKAISEGSDDQAPRARQMVKDIEWAFQQDAASNPILARLVRFWSSSWSASVRPYKYQHMEESLIFSHDELLVMLRHNSPALRCLAAERLQSLQSWETSLPVIGVLAGESNLFVVARIVSRLKATASWNGRLAGEFSSLSPWSCLDAANVSRAWRRAADGRASPIYSAYLALASRRATASTNEVASALKTLEEFLLNDPTAVYARCLKVKYHLLNGTLDEAEKQLSEMTNAVSIHQVLFWRGALRLRQGHKEGTET